MAEKKTVKRRHKKKPEQQTKIAKERIEILFEQAFKRFNEDSDLSDKYVKLARKIAMKYKIKIPSTLKRQFCHTCYAYLLPPYNVRIRMHKGILSYYCMKCKSTTRFGYK